jgi:hypothetical protein
MTEHDKPADKPHENLGRAHPAAGGESNARTDDKKPAARQGEHVAPMTTDQAVTEPAGPPHVGGRAMYVIVGPYKGNVLIMPEDEAENAKDNHWAINQSDMEGPFDAANPYEHDHELTDEDRENAVREANEWAEKVKNPPPPDPPPEGGDTEGGGLRRTVPDRGLRPAPGGDYVTRNQPGEPRPHQKPEPTADPRRR